LLGKQISSNDPIFVFTDPGIDDALALAMLARSEKLRLFGACGVDGNVSPQIATTNLAGLLRLFGAKDTSVFKSPINDPVHEYPVDVHGKDGLGKIRIAKARIPRKKVLADFLQSQKNRFQILSLGPLTAVADILEKFPEVAKQVSRIVMMGGGFERGNVTPYAEFNIYTNPEAAELVFSSFIPKIVIPLDVTEKVKLESKDLEMLRTRRTAAARALAGMLLFYFNFEKKKENGFFGGYMHDPSVVAAISNPELFKFRQAKVRVDTSNSETRGRTVAKFSHGKKANSWVALDVDEKGVRSVIMDGLLGRA
jgi:purine nucleosidase